MLRPPAHIKSDKVALGEFRRVQAGANLQEADLSLLSDYAESFSACHQYRSMLDSEPALVSSPTGALVPNPLLKLYNDERDRLHKLRAALGFTPQSRKQTQLKKEKKGGLLERIG